MRSYILHLVLLFIALGSPSLAQKTDTEVVVREGAPLTIECSLRVEQRVEWSVGGAKPAPDLHASELPPAGGLARARLSAAAARERHAGVYTCTREADARPVRVRVLPRSTAPAESEPASTTESIGGDSDALQVPLIPYLYELGRKSSIVLNCTSSMPGPTTYMWKKDDKDLESVESLKTRYKLEEGGSTFRLTDRATEDDYGNYTCSIGGAVALGWQVEAKAIAKLPSDMSVVEGQKLKITCKVYGKPYPAVQWTYSADELDNGTDVTKVAGERVEVRDSPEGVPGGELVLSGVTRADAGRYSCAPVRGSADLTTVRVKGMYDALWPFLGICAEVFVLCTIILVYEKRRTKPELDDSDADNHDQKKS